ncbi:hypothetical protein [Oceanobacter kriegii]|uniref:hypothetical protein n=1 Tax=Oceanobacter kriegii TaxID=64972 RepID=UPI0003F984C7|nr:hypothetical protein [Oceanobacter kriegii]
MTTSPDHLPIVWITSYGLRGSVAPLTHANDMILEADERILPDGSVVRALQPETLALQLMQARRLGYTQVRVALMHSDAYPAHRDWLMALTRQMGFDVVEPVSLATADLSGSLPELRFGVGFHDDDRGFERLACEGIECEGLEPLEQRFPVTVERLRLSPQASAREWMFKARQSCEIRLPAELIERWQDGRSRVVVFRGCTPQGEPLSMAPLLDVKHGISLDADDSLLIQGWD